MTQPQPYNWARPGRLTAEAEHRLAVWLRAASALAVKKAARHLPFTIEISVRGTAVDHALEALERLPDAAVGYGVGVSSKTAAALLVLPRPLALALISGMLGDEISAMPEDRELTRVDDEVCRSFVEDALVRTLEETWPAAEPVSLTLLAREPHPRWSRAFPPEENVVVCTFDIKGPFGDSAWYWVLSEKHLLEQLARSAPGAGKAKAPGGLPEAERLRLLVEELPVDVTVVLGTVELTLAELARLRPGDLIVLDQRVSEPLPAYVAGEKKCRGWPGRVGSQQAFEIESFLGS